MESPIEWLCDPLGAEESQLGTVGTVFRGRVSAGIGFLWTLVRCSVRFLLLRVLSGVPNGSLVECCVFPCIVLCLRDKCLSFLSAFHDQLGECFHIHE